MARPLMDEAAAGHDAARAYSTGLVSGGVQAAPVLDFSQSSLKTQDQGSVSDSDTKDWDAGSDCDTAPVSDCDTDEVQKLSHIAVAILSGCMLWDGFRLAAFVRRRMRK